MSKRIDAKKAADLKQIQINKEKALGRLAVEYKTYDALQGPTATIAIAGICMVFAVVALIDLVKLYRFIKWGYKKIKARRQIRPAVPEITIKMVEPRSNQYEEDEESEEYLEKKRKRDELLTLEVQFYRSFLIAKHRNTLRKQTTFKRKTIKSNRIDILKRKK